MAYTPVYHATQATVLIGLETTWGTAVTADKDIGLVQSITPTLASNLKRFHTVGSATTQHIAKGRFESGFDIECIYQNARLLDYAMGSVGHVETTTDWKHTFAYASPVPSLTLEHSYNTTTDFTVNSDGCCVSSVSYGVALDGAVTQRATIIGRIPTTTASSQTAVISTIDPLHDFQASISVGTEGSETAMKGVVQNWEVTFNMEPGRIFGLGSSYAQDIKDMRKSIEFSFSIGFTSNEEYNRFLDGATADGAPEEITSTPFGIVFNVTNAVALGSGRFELNFGLSKAIYATLSDPIVIGEFTIVEVTGWTETIQTSQCFSVDNIADTAWE